MYRAMETTAKLSGCEEVVDKYGRVKVVGGDYEYRHLPTADNSGVNRVPKEVA